MTQIRTHDLIQAAAHQAAGGNYQAAAALLDQAGPEGESLEALLLRAKIAAQQKQYDQAIGFWEQALRLDPDCSHAREGIALARRLRSSPVGGFFLRAGLYYAILLLLVVVLSAILIGGGLALLGRGRPDDLIRQISVMQTDLKTLNTTVQDLESKLRESQSQMESFQQLAVKTAQAADEQNRRLTGLLEEIRHSQQEQTARQEQMEARVLRAQEDWQSQFDAYRQDVADLLGLSEDMRLLTEQWGRIEKKWFGPGPAQRRQMQEDLDRLNETMESLLGAMKQEPEVQAG
jgi:tetratricopeptide (TPR) repeat protein